MPGYAITRFVGISESERSELSCALCHSVFKEPVITECCGQAFCKDCVTDWIQTYATCPYDWQPLDTNGLSAPPKLVKNLLGKLGIKCYYEGNGCQDVLPLQDLARHETTCPYNIRTCDTCAAVLSGGPHDCVEELKKLNSKLNEEIVVLKTRNDSLLKTSDETNWSAIEEINGLKLEKEGLVKNFSQLKMTYKQEISALMTENQNLLNASKQSSKAMVKNGSPESRMKSNSSSCSLSSNAISFQLNNTIRELIIESRKYLKKPIVIDSNVSDDMAQQIIGIVCDELRVQEIMWNVCKNVVYKLDIELGSSWYCLVNYNRSGHNFCNCSYFIKLRIGSLFFKVFRTKFLDLPILRRRLRQGKIERKLQVFEAKMSDNMVAAVEPLIFEALDKSDSIKDIASVIRNSIQGKYGGQWMCFVFNYGEQNRDISFETYLYCEVSELKIIVLKVK